MREIKFRAWDDVDNRFWYKDFFDRNWYTESNGGLCIQRLLPEDKYILAEVEQYTGLKDKNGKEIFEGDIVEYYSCGFIHRYGKVFCENGKFRCGILGLDAQDLYEHIFKTKIIGNIHKNPELLEDVR